MVKLMTLNDVTWHGIDKDGDALAKFPCGHVLGFPMDSLRERVRLGQGLELRHSMCGITNFVMPEDLPALVSGLEDMSNG